MTFAHPLAFLLLAPVAAAAWCLFRRTRGRATRFSLARLVPTRATVRKRLAALAPFAFTAAMVACVIALAGPRTGVSEIHHTNEAIAIEMAVDISGSMQALDFATTAAPERTRLDVVKETFRAFVEKRPADLIGLVAFGGYATTRCPLTFDHGALAQILDTTIVPGSDGVPVDRDEGETAIGDGLALACARLENASNVVSRIVILLSDGVNNYGLLSPEQATALAAEKGIKVYVIGVGKGQRTTALIRDRNGVKRIVPMFAPMDEASLTHIANATGGRYFNVRNGDMLEEALREIDALEKTAVDETIWKDWDDRFAPFLVAALALLVAAILLGRGRI